ncbi:MAG: hypothetical protein AB9907_10475 [Flexilinea sp.]
MTEDPAKKIYITMDIDWACDEVLADTLDLIDSLAIPVTIFVTHETSLLNRMRQNPCISLGIHPNFYPLLHNTSDRDYLTIIKDIKAIVPEAVCARSHGLIDATSILLAFHEQGIRNDLNLFIPFSSGIPMVPFIHFSGIKRIPYFYEDDAFCFEKDKKSPEEHVLNSGNGLKVFNFHPIHLFLNTEAMERYNNAKPYNNDFPKLKQFVNSDPENGARTFLKRIVRCAKENGYRIDQVGNL